MLSFIWYPTASLVASDERTAAAVTYTRSAFSLNASRPWVTGLGPYESGENATAGQRYDVCRECAEYTFSGSATVLMSPAWKYDFYPFDRHNISFVISVPDTNLSSCSEILYPMGFSAGGSIDGLLPATQEWNYRSADLGAPITVGHPHGDVSKCEVVIKVSRNPFVFLIKQLLMTMIAVWCGLCALYLHVGEHTGDRAALIIVSALICSNAFTTDLDSLPTIQYLIWFDYWNLSQLAILVPTLFVALYEHRLFISDQAEYSNTLNKSTRWVLPFGYYPVLCLAMLVWGINHDEDSSGPTVGWWCIIIIGFSVVSITAKIQLSANLNHEKRRRAHTVHLLRHANPNDASYVNTLREAYVAFDTDDSGDISLAELREMLEHIFPDYTRVKKAEVMKEVKELANSDDAFDENSFIDAVLIAIKRLRGAEFANINYDPKEASKHLIPQMLPSKTWAAGLFGFQRTKAATVDVVPVASTTSLPTSSLPPAKDAGGDGPPLTPGRQRTEAPSATE